MDSKEETKLSKLHLKLAKIQAEINKEMANEKRKIAIGNLAEEAGILQVDPEILAAAFAKIKEENKS